MIKETSEQAVQPPRQQPTLRIPFFIPSIGQAEIDEVVDTLRKGWLTTGPKTKKFEAEFARYLGHAFAVGVNSCTAALHLALEAIGIREGEGVLVPTMTFAATAEVVRYLNAIPVLVDCRESDFTIDISSAEEQLLQAQKRGVKVVAIIPVHYGGQVADMAGVCDLARRYQLKIIEDAAHCCPAYYRQHAGDAWRSVGSESDISCFSFYANKTITTGEGGMACTGSAEYADRMRIMSLHGISRDAWKRFTSEGVWYYEITAPGFKYNLTDIASSIGLHQLRAADQLHRQRSLWAECYTHLLQDVEELILPEVQPNRIHSWHLYVIRLRLEKLSIDRAAFIDRMRDQGIGASVHWMPLHMHPYYREKFAYKPGDLPRAAALYPEIISLPLYPDLTEGDVRFVVNSIKEILAAHRR